MPINTLNAYKALQMSYESLYNKQEPPVKTVNIGQNGKNRKKTVPNLKFASVFGFFFLQPHPTPFFLN